MSRQHTTALSQLVEMSRSIRMSASDLAAQRISFAYGTTHIENSNVTRQMVIDAASQKPIAQAKPKA